MTSSPKDSLIPSPLAAIALKLVGVITIALAFIDFLILLFPPNFGNRAWQLAVVSSLVDTGIVPLIGIVLLLTGYWIDSSIGKSNRRASLATDARFWTCLFSCLLGLIFLMTTVVHPNNVRLQSKDELAQVETNAEQAAAELESRLSADISQRRSQIDTILSDDAQLEAARANGSLDDAQLAQIERFRTNPQELDSFLTSQATEAQEQLQLRIGEEKTTRTAQLKTDALKATVGVTLSSLLLSIAYTFIGWAGLKRLLAMVN
ncbi:MAG: HpsJ family protein [Cyanobacteria bacterium J06560_2]